MRNRTAKSAWGALCACVLLVLLAPAAASAEEGGTIRIMIIDLEAKGVTPEVAQTLTDSLATALAKSGEFSVAGSSDVKAMLRNAEEKQLAGCADEACYSGIGKLLGADLVIRGSIGKIGEKYILNVAKIDVSTAKIKRVQKTASRPELLIDGLASVATGLIGNVTPSVRRDDKPVEFLRSREQCVWSAIQYKKGRKKGIRRPKKRYVAAFGSEHFKFTLYDKLEEHLPLKPDLLYLGKFPSCFGRQETYEDAFTIKEERPMVIKVGSTSGYDLVKLHRRRKLVLLVEFEIRGARTYQAREFDWRSCDGDAKPFNPTDIASNAWIKVKSAVLLDMFNERKYAVTRQKWDPGSETISLVSLPMPPRDPTLTLDWPWEDD